LVVFRYLSLHKSPFYAEKHDGRELPHTDHFSDCLLRLPMFYDLTVGQVSDRQEMRKMILHDLHALHGEISLKMPKKRQKMPKKRQKMPKYGQKLSKFVKNGPKSLLFVKKSDFCPNSEAS